jgi:hypothetical protein
LYLIYAESSGSSDWGSYLAEAQQADKKPAVLWTEQELTNLQGTQVLDSVLQYRYDDSAAAVIALSTCCSASHFAD